MHSFFKALLTGVLYTLLLPFILIIWVSYGVYCVFIFIYMFFRTIIVWIKGGTPLGDLPEEVEAKRILIARQDQQDMMNQAIMNMYQNPAQTPVSPNMFQQSTTNVIQQENNEQTQEDDFEKDKDEVSW